MSGPMVLQRADAGGTADFLANGRELQGIFGGPDMQGKRPVLVQRANTQPILPAITALNQRCGNGPTNREMSWAHPAISSTGTAI